jgi:hypothetical protein
MAKKMSFVARFGNSCGTAFKKDVFFKKHRQWQKFEPYIKDRPSQPWTNFSITKTASKFSLTKKSKTQKTEETDTKKTDKTITKKNI